MHQPNLFNYTKRYYAESQRIASKIGAGFGGSPVDMTQPLGALYDDVAEISVRLEDMLERVHICAQLKSGNVTMPEPVLAIVEDLSNIPSDSLESDMYFYHSDHLGSSSFITVANGNAIQLPIAIGIQYMPYGAPKAFGVVDQRLSNWNTPYTFSSKEKDEEMGYSYFGARYYDSELSVWLSVDPLADKYPGTSPYMYVRGNPVMLVDPDGRKVDPAGEDEAKAYKAYKTKIEDEVKAYDNKTNELRERGTRFSKWRADRRERKRDQNVYVQIQSELKQLEESDVVFKIRMTTNIEATLPPAAEGSTTYNGKNKEVDINIGSSSMFSTVQTMAHELLHAYQALIGDLDFSPNGKAGILYDKSDEIAAFERTNLFANSIEEMVSPSDYVSSHYPDIPSESKSYRLYTDIEKQQYKYQVKAGKYYFISKFE